MFSFPSSVGRVGPGGDNEVRVTCWELEGLWDLPVGTRTHQAARWMDGLECRRNVGTGDEQWEISRGPIILMSPCYCGLNCEPQKDIFKSSPLKVFVTMIVFGERVFGDVISYMGGAKYSDWCFPPQRGTCGHRDTGREEGQGPTKAEI